VSDDLDKLVAEAQPVDDLDSLVAGAQPVTPSVSPLANAAKWWASQPKVGLMPIPLGEGDALTKVASFTNGVTQGLAPAIGAASDVVGAAASGALPPHPVDEFMAKREGLRRFYTGAESEEPALSLAGAMMTPMPGGKARGVAGIAGRIGMAGGLGAINAEERAEPTRALDAGEGGALAGTGLAMASEALGPVSGAASNWLLGKSRDAYLKAAGGVQSNIAKLRDPNAVADFIRAKDLAPFGSTPATANERVGEFLDSGGARLGDTLDKLSDMGVVVSGPRAAERVRAIGKRLDPLSAEAYGPRVESVAASLEKAGDQPLNVANQMKGHLQDLAKYSKRQASPDLALNRQMARVFRDEMLSQAGEQAPGVRPVIEGLLKDYSLAKDVESLSSRGAAASSGNRALGLSEQLAAVGAMAGGAGPLGALKAVGGANVIKNRGASMAAPLLRAGADLLPQRSIGTPAATSAAARKLWEWYGVAPKDDEDISRTHADKQLPGL
jgi:hypothetical protein